MPIVTSNSLVWTLAGCLLSIGLNLGCTVLSEDEESATTTSSVAGTPNPNGKDTGGKCKRGDECRSGVCEKKKCRAPSNKDRVKNGDETDVDCGGAAGPGCADGQACVTGDDCANGACVNGVCGGDGQGVVGGDDQQPGEGQFGDGIRNGGETDVDCGGPDPGPRCGVGKACLVHSDCASNGCAFDGRCAERASCTQLEGGQTCGPSDGMGKQNDCCESASVGGYRVDKYLVTAGRMRAFLTRLDGRVRDWAATLPPDRWNQAYTSRLPNGMGGAPGDGDDAFTQLGPYFGKRSCETGYHTGHTFWTPPEYGDTKDFPQNVLDMKALNCVPWPLLMALCAFDGGHLVTEAELRAAYTNGGATAYPWGARSGYTTTGQNDFAIQQWSYSTAGNARQNQNGFLDVAAYIAPPGRRPRGYNQTGHADLVGNLLEWVSDRDRQFIWNGSFERHAYEGDMIEAPLDHDPYVARDERNRPFSWSQVGAQDGNPNGYYAIGGRCAY